MQTLEEEVFTEVYSRLEAGEVIEEPLAAKLNQYGMQVSTVKSVVDKMREVADAE